MSAIGRSVSLRVPSNTPPKLKKSPSMQEFPTDSYKLLFTKEEAEHDAKKISNSEYDRLTAKIPLASIKELATIQKMVKDGNDDVLSRLFRVVKHIPYAIYKSIFNKDVRNASIKGIQLTFNPSELKKFRQSLVRILAKWDIDHKGKVKQKQIRGDELNELRNSANEIKIPDNGKLEQIHDKLMKERILSEDI